MWSENKDGRPTYVKRVTARAANLNETVKRCEGQRTSLGGSTKNN